jgi:hypothetical protein
VAGDGYVERERDEGDVKGVVEKTTPRRGYWLKKKTGYAARVAAKVKGYAWRVAPKGRGFWTYAARVSMRVQPYACRVGLGGNW